MGLPMKPFTLHVPEAAIARPARAPRPHPLPRPGARRAWAYGTDVDYLRGLVDYWRDGFDWRAQEARLNAFPQHKVPLHGIDLHFLHVPGKGPAPLPLLLLHGWPGSVFEFLEIIPRLTDPGAVRRRPGRCVHGGRALAAGLRPVIRARAAALLGASRWPTASPS